MLKEVGAECAGAISILAEGKKPNDPCEPEFKTLTDDEGYDLLTLKVIVNNYLHRTIGCEIETYLSVFGAILLMSQITGSRLFLSDA